MNASPHGWFPFGRPNTVRPARLVENSQVLFIGVYPSAWHVEWMAPAYAESKGPKGAVASMAVDVEPTVFWDAAEGDFLRRLESWKSTVGFVPGHEPGQHGIIKPESPSTNGVSGRKVVDRYVHTGLNLSVGCASFTDVYPVYMNHIKKWPRSQGIAVREEYDPIAGLLGYEPSTIGKRILSRKLPLTAANEFGSRVVADILAVGAPLVVTLGEEPWATLALINDISLLPPVSTFDGLYGPAYGTRGSLSVGSYRAEFLPLVHPNLLRRSRKDVPADLPTASTDRGLGWEMLHARWEQSKGLAKDAPART